MPNWLRWPLACALAALALLAGATPARITQAQAVLQPEGGAPHAAAVALPHSWDDGFPGQGGAATYGFTVPALAQGGSRGLFIPRVGNQFEVWIDGERVYRAGRLGDARSDSAKGPVWIAFSESDAESRVPAQVRVRLTAQAARWGGLSAPWAGPEDEVFALYRAHYQLRQYGGLAVCVALVLMALMAAGFWWVQRDAVYLVFALASLCGALRVGDRLLEYPPLPWPLWGAVTAVALVVYLLLMAYFSLQLVQRGHWLRQPWVLLLVACAVVAGATAFWLGEPRLWTVATGLLVPVALVTWVGLVDAAWAERSTGALAVLLVGSAVIAAALRDWLVVRVLGEGSGTVSLLPHATLLFVLLMGGLLVARFAGVARANRELLATLDARVHQRELELERNSLQLREEHARQATLQERQRLMRDIHDGVGAQLAGLRSLLARGQLSRDVLRAHADAALDELHMAMDALQPVHGDLATVLATLRYRMQPRLDAAAIQVDWQVDALPELEGLTPTVVLQLQRVLQEAFTNVIRHAQATQLWVRAWLDEGPPEQLVLSVEDDGQGIVALPAVSGDGQGQGLVSMHARAVAIGAELTICSGTRGGTLVRLALPRRPVVSA